MKKTKPNRLKLHRETIRMMTPRDLAEARGGVLPSLTMLCTIDLICTVTRDTCHAECKNTITWNIC